MSRRGSRASNFSLRISSRSERMCRRATLRRAAFRSIPVTGWPAASRQAVMLDPIKPRPTTPTGAARSLLDFEFRLTILLLLLRSLPRLLSFFINGNEKRASENQQSAQDQLRRDLLVDEHSGQQHAEHRKKIDGERCLGHINFLDHPKV